MEPWETANWWLVPTSSEIVMILNRSSSLIKSFFLFPQAVCSLKSHQISSVYWNLSQVCLLCFSHLPATIQKVGVRSLSNYSRMFFSLLLPVFKACDKGLVLFSLVAPREIFWHFYWFFCCSIYFCRWDVLWFSFCHLYQEIIHFWQDDKL